jgi:hypothetical protein
MKRVDEADIIVGKMPYGLRSIWQGAHARPILPDGRLQWPWRRPGQPKRKRAYYRALLRDEPWAKALKSYLLRTAELVQRLNGFYDSHNGDF